MILKRISTQKNILAKIAQVGVRFISTGNALRKNLYETLGLTRNATQTDIKNAYFELSKLYHPDRIAATDETLAKFREVSAAYEILGNEQSRKLYDRGLLGDFKKIGVDEPEETDPIVKFYKQRHEVSKLTTPPQDAWFETYYKEAKKAARKHELFVKSYQEADAEYDMIEKHIFRFALTIIACFLILTEFENTTPNKIWKKITFQ